MRSPEELDPIRLDVVRKAASAILGTVEMDTFLLPGPEVLTVAFALDDVFGETPWETRVPRPFYPRADAAFIREKMSAAPRKPELEWLGPISRLLATMAWVRELDHDRTGAVAGEENATLEVDLVRDAFLAVMDDRMRAGRKSVSVDRSTAMYRSLTVDEMFGGERVGDPMSLGEPGDDYAILLDVAEDDEAAVPFLLPLSRLCQFLQYSLREAAPAGS